MTLKYMKERRTADRVITGVFKNPRMYESLNAPSRTHPINPKRRQMWICFMVGFAAGIIGFVLLFVR